MHHALRFGFVLTVGFTMVFGLAAPANASSANSSASSKAGSKAPSSMKGVQATAAKTNSPFLSAKEFRALTPDQQAKYITLLRNWMVGIEEAQNLLSNSEAKKTKGKKSANSPTLFPRDIAKIFETFFAAMSQAEAYQVGEECINGGFFSEWITVKNKVGDQLVSRLLCSSSKANLEGDLTNAPCPPKTSKCAAIPYGFKDASNSPICVPPSAKLSQSCLAQAQKASETVEQLLNLKPAFDGNFDKLEKALNDYVVRLTQMKIPEDDTAFQKEARTMALDRTRELLKALEALKATRDAESRKAADALSDAKQQPAPKAPCSAEGAAAAKPVEPCDKTLPAPPPPAPPKDKELLGAELSCVYHGLASKFPQDPPSEKFLALLGVAAQQYDGPFNPKDPASLAEYRKAVIKMVQSYGYCSEKEYTSADETPDTKSAIRGWLMNEGNVKADEVYLERALNRTKEANGYTGRNSFLAIFGLSATKRIPLVTQSDVELLFRPVDKETWGKLSLAEKQQNWYGGTHDLKTQIPPAGSVKKTHEEWLECRQAAKNRMDHVQEFKLQYTDGGLAYDDPNEFYDSQGRQNARKIPDDVTRAQGTGTQAPIEKRANEIYKANLELCEHIAKSCGFTSFGAGGKDNFCGDSSVGFGLQKGTIDGQRCGKTGQCTERIRWRQGVQ